MPAFSHLAAGAELIIRAPLEVNLKEEFSVVIDADLSGQFDVKIFVHSSSDERVSRNEYISEIFNPVAQMWKDSWFYIEGSFPEIKTYNLKVLESKGERKICLRLRKTGGQTSYIQCEQITILEEKKSNSESRSELEEEPEVNEKEKTENNLNRSTNKESKTEQYLSYIPEKTEQKQERIILNSPPTEIEPADFLITKDEKIRRLVVYSFLAFTIFLLILIGLRKL